MKMIRRLSKTRSTRSKKISTDSWRINLLALGRFDKCDDLEMKNANSESN